MPARSCAWPPNNLLADDYLSGRTITINGLAQSAFGTARTYAALSIKLELKL